MTDSTAAAIGFIRPELAKPSPYRWQEGVPVEPLGRFDMNTLPRDPAWWPEVAAEIARIPVCSYPEATFQPLREAIGRYAGFPWQQVVPGAGADEILLLTALLALGRGDTALVCRPTYQMYAVATRTAGARLVALEPREGLAIDWDGMIAAAPEARVVWICSPNNPTGEEASPAAVRALCAACPGLVVVDQAYLELGGEDLSGIVAELENLVVVRTFSKGWGLAALRVGYALASPAVAGALDALRPPGSLSTQSAYGAQRAVDFTERMRSEAAAYAEERGRLAEGMRELGLEVLGEAGPFVSARVPWSGEEAFARLSERRLVVRTFAHEPLLADVIRASVAEPAANDLLLAALAELLDRPAPAPAPAELMQRISGRVGTVSRQTKETTIRCSLGLDGSGRAQLSTGVGFLDHMLNALAFHGLFDLELDVQGDLHVDEHHTVEDVGIALGQALDRALGDRGGIRRFGDAAAPLDEALARCVVDLGGRGVSAIDLELSGAPVGGVVASLWPHMLDSFARAGRVNLHLTSAGDDDHHVIEAAFKALARALRTAVERDPRRAGAAIPSTKGAI